MKIELRQIRRNFGRTAVLKDVSLTIPSGGLVVLLGPSGSGKTTLLRILAGLDFPDAGEVLFGDTQATNRKARDRGVGFVFQHYALFRHMTVLDNVAFGLRVRARKARPSRAEIRKRAEELLKLVQLDQLADRLPSQLSGGQRQRVALARALAVEPQVLLLDEPFGSLDARVRLELRRWLRRLHDEIHITSVFVTHDQEEALEVADLVVVMNEGRIAQVGTPEEIYEHPADAFVCDFLGNVNVFRGCVREGIAYIGERAVDLPSLFGDRVDNASIYVRPHHLEISVLPHPLYPLCARIAHLNIAGPVAKVELHGDWGDAVRVELSRERAQGLALKTGAEIFVRAREIRVFTDSGMELKPAPIERHQNLRGVAAGFR
jgi:sulfate transport system ATP-binding protein